MTVLLFDGCVLLTSCFIMQVVAETKRKRDEAAAETKRKRDEAAAEAAREAAEAERRRQPNAMMGT